MMWLFILLATLRQRASSSLTSKYLEWYLLDSNRLRGDNRGHNSLSFCPISGPFIYFFWVGTRGPSQGIPSQLFLITLLILVDRSCLC